MAYASAALLLLHFWLAAPTAIAYLPAAFALAVHEGLRIYAHGGGVGFDHLAGPVGVILDDAICWQLLNGHLVGIPCAVFGAALGATIGPSARVS